MPLVYASSLATAGNTSANATPNTETEVFFLKAGLRNAALSALYVIGKGAGLSVISGIAFRVIKWGTASTGGTGITPQPEDPGVQGATATAASAPTAGTTRTNRFIIGCGATGPGGWIAENVDSVELLSGGGAPSVDVLSVSGTASLAFEFSFKHNE